MSYPYTTDLFFGSEKASSDFICHISFSKPIVVGDVVLFRSNTYSVTNDYVTSDLNNVVVNSQRDAYSELEINKADWDALDSELQSNFSILFFDQNGIKDSTILFVGSFFNDTVPKYAFLTSEDITTPSNFPPCTLTTVTSKLYKAGQTMGSFEPINCICKIRTFIDMSDDKSVTDFKENTDATYIPLYWDGSNDVPVHRENYTPTISAYRTEPFNLAYSNDPTTPVSVIASFDNPVVLTLDNLIGGVYKLEESKGLHSSISIDDPDPEHSGKEVLLQATLLGGSNTIPKILVYQGDGMSVTSTIYTADGHELSGTLVIPLNSTITANIIKVEE